MGSINSAFSLITAALDADQAALNIVSNNVANANTTGYTRQIPNWRENDPINISGVTVGTGASVTGAISVRDRVLEQRLNQQEQLASASGSRLAALHAMETLFTPNSGAPGSAAGDIGSDITAFFNSFSSLEADPANNALRENVLSAASKLAGDLSNAAASLTAQRASLDQEAGGIVSQVNALTAALGKLNLQIQSLPAGTDAGTLEDQRQQDLLQLSQLIGINQISTENNGVAITTTSGQLLASQGTSQQLTSGLLNGVTHFFLGTQDVTDQLTAGGGALGGILTARDVDIPKVLKALDEIAYDIAIAVNTQNNLGKDANGATSSPAVDPLTGARSLDVFAPPPTLVANGTTDHDVSGAALAIRVVMTDASNIAASSTTEGVGGNSNAAAIADLAGSLKLKGKTPSDFYAGLVTNLGSTVSQVQTENTAQIASVTQLQTQRDALSSVNLNDEASALTLLERSYQAASQIFAIINSIMASALNLGERTSVS
jgi:flagellar hook-associated protein 1 FlgK